MAPLGLGHGIHTDTSGLAEIFSNKYSLGFNGSDEFVEINAVGNDITPGTKGTISMWVVMPVTSGSATLIRGSADSSNEIFIFWHNSSDELRFTHEAGGTGKKVQYGFSEYDHTSWIHVAMTWDTTANELKGYVNGAQVGSTIGSLGTFSGTIDDMDLARNPADGAYFKGQMDEVSIWTDVMDISELYNGGVRRNVEFSGLDPTKLAAYYQFEEGTGTTTADQSRHANTGNLNNTPTWTAL